MILTDLLALSHVPRWCNVRHSPPQSVADHSFRVAVIYLELCSRLKWEPTLQGLTYALLHDGAESYTGDIPGDFKKMVSEELAAAEAKLPQFAPKPRDPEYRLAKLADKLEGYTFIKTNGVGYHAKRIEGLMFSQLIEMSGPDWNVVRLLAQDITEESGRD